MDGNNRWSKKNNCSKYHAYNFGAEKLIKLSRFLFYNYDLNFISAFALSRNNLNRSSSIINSIKKVLSQSLKRLDLNKNDFDIFFIGNFNFLDMETKKKIYEINNIKKNKKKLIIYLNYGGREDIENAAKSMNKSQKPFKDFLHTKNLPDPDILVRTGGYKRISNFLLYQLAFTELFFMKKLWPDIKNNDLNKIIEKFHTIERKFGR